MYILQYWNGNAAEWRNAGFQTADYDKALKSLRAHQVMTDHSVRFRIEAPSVAG